VDFDGDGRLDLAATDGWIVQIRLGDGSGSFPRTVFRHRFRLPTHDVVPLEAGDFDEDGLDDLVAIAFPDAFIVHGTPDPGSPQPVSRSFPDAVSALTVLAEDFDGDRHLDLVVAGKYLFLGDGSGGFEMGDVIPDISYASETAAADFDEDGDLDLAILIGRGYGNNLFLLRDGGRAGSPPGTPSVDRARSRPWTSTATGRSIWWRGRWCSSATGGAASGRSSRSGGRAASCSSPPATSTGTDRPTSPCCTTTRASPSCSRCGPRPRRASSTSIGDGHLDVLTGGSPQLKVVFGDPRGLGPRQKSIRAFDVRQVAVADLDEDGALDAIATAEDAGRVLFARGDGTGGFAFPVALETRGTPDGIVVRDFDGDGALDAATADEVVDANGRRSRATIHFGNGSGGGSSPTAVDIRDLDGDGAPDVVVPTTRRASWSCAAGASGRIRCDAARGTSSGARRRSRFRSFA